MNTNNICPHCGHTLSDNTSNMICMHCGHSITPEKKFDNVDANKIGQKDENTINAFASLGALWWVLLIIVGIVSSIVSLVFLFELL